MRIPRPDNTIISAILRSPGHRILSGAVLLIRFQGRVSRRTYIIPVQYLEHQDLLVVAVLDSARKQWWRNLRTNPEVEILLKGRWLRARGDVVEGDATLRRLYIARFRWASRQLGEETVFVVLSEVSGPTRPRRGPGRVESQ
ncbi:MAG TPA: nitroreductase/quinone reductase family protein [Acidimicrobiia bacterium]|nr:nitroreductase/quinone reductase family protein [Acidimicrobiia bacterium]